MATRHEIQNLVRRGNVFYWRPRVPRRFGKAGQGHLSWSLRQSDHMKARYMARRLNTLLHDLQQPDVALTTKDQLEALFRTEVERMGEHLDNLQFAAKRTGSDPLLSLRADLEVGWAYRLIETFGTMRRLTFSEGCLGRVMLEREGIPAAERNEVPMKLDLGTNTIRKHLGNLAEFLRYLRGRGYAVRQLSLEGLRPPKLKPSDIRTLTDKPGPERLRPMFLLPVFTGCLDAKSQHVAGDQIFHSANYYVPMLLTYLGARRNEITG